MSANANPAQTMLIVNRQAPYRGNGAREALDMLLAAAAFEQDVAGLWLDDGVWQLVPEQKPSAIGEKNLQAMLGALPIYGIERLYVAGDDLRARGLNPAQLALPVDVLDTKQVKALLADQAMVLSL